jgi:hypothetical protein
MGSSGSHPLTAPLPSEIYPLDQIAYLRAAGATGNLLAPFSSGEFAAWALYPKMKVAIDGRFEEVYSLEESRKWLGFFNGASADSAQMARANGVNWIIVPKINSGTIRSLDTSGLWDLRFDRQNYNLYAERGKATQSISVPSAEPTIADYFTPEDRARFTSYQP